jgi:N-acetyl sugar amidotransferase
MKELIWCQECLLPNSRPNLFINSNGICNACLNNKNKNYVNWKKRLILLKRIVRNIKKKNSKFDCLIPVSGGKDSTWQTFKCLELGLRPLAFTWRPPERTPIGEKNLKNLISLGVDHIDWTINPNVESKFTLKSFIKFGSTAIPMHMAIHNISRNIAANFGIPLIVWGENSALEYGQNSDADLSYKVSKNWRKYYGVNNGTTFYDWVENDLTEKELASYYPYYKNSNKKTIEIFLGNFLKWDPVNIYNFSKKKGFKSNNEVRTGFYKFADIDDNLISIHHWMKWYKFGFTRLFDNLSIEIRNKRLTRLKAINLIKENKNFLPLSDIKKFCHFTNIKVSYFFKIAQNFRNKMIWKKVHNKWMINNFLIKDWKWHKY